MGEFSESITTSGHPEGSSSTGSERGDQEAMFDGPEDALPLGSTLQPGLHITRGLEVRARGRSKGGVHLPLWPRASIDELLRRIWINVMQRGASRIDGPRSSSVPRILQARIEAMRRGLEHIAEKGRSALRRVPGK